MMNKPLRTKLVQFKIYHKYHLIKKAIKSVIFFFVAKNTVPVWDFKGIFLLKLSAFNMICWFWNCSTGYSFKIWSNSADWPWMISVHTNLTISTFSDEVQSLHNCNANLSVSWQPLYSLKDLYKNCRSSFESTCQE